MESIRNFTSEYLAIKDQLIALEVDLIDEICKFLKENDLKSFRFINSQGIEFDTIKYIASDVFKVEFIDEKTTYKVKQTSSNMDIEELLRVYGMVKFYSQYDV